MIALGEWRKFLRDRLRFAKAGEQSTKWRKIARRRTRLGLYATLIWLLGFAALTISHELPDAGNEWGDWAAGLAAPIAFLLARVGLPTAGPRTTRESSRALHLQEQALQLQVKELRESVEQQTRLATSNAKSVAQQERAHAISVKTAVLPLQPRFTGFQMVLPDQRGGKLRIAIHNSGASCHEVGIYVHFEDGKKTTLVPVAYWATHAEGAVAEFRVPGKQHVLQLVIEFRDALLVRQTHSFEIPLSDTWPIAGQGLSATLKQMTLHPPDPD